MTEQEKELQQLGLFDLSHREQFLKEFRSGQDRHSLVTDFLEAALQSHDNGQLEDALYLGAGYGFSNSHLPLLIILLQEEWHCRHEDLVITIDAFKSDNAIDALNWAANVRLSYLDYDDSEALARKAIYALAKIPSPRAKASLEAIAQSSNNVRRYWAKHKLGKT